AHANDGAVWAVAVVEQAAVARRLLLRWPLLLTPLEFEPQPVVPVFSQRRQSAEHLAGDADGRLAVELHNGKDLVRVLVEADGLLAAVRLAEVALPAGEVLAVEQRLPVVGCAGARERCADQRKNDGREILETHRGILPTTPRGSARGPLRQQLLD